MTATIHLFKGKTVSDKPTVIEAFPGKGYVSTIAAGQIIAALDMELIGFIDSDITAGITVVHDGTPLKPIQIYAKNQFVVIYSEAVIPLDKIPEFSKALEDWLNQIKPKEMILLAGVTGTQSNADHAIFTLCSHNACQTKLDALKVPHLKEGMMIGVSSELLFWCRTNEVPYVSLMVETVYSPDPAAAASLLTILNDILGIKVDTAKLSEVGEEIEKKMKDITEHVKRGRDGYKQMECDSPMYG
ncbi:PAC2 family protein [uncultured archaeon]|nr:PAC2 family protein [uncultured archaeon]